jgi:phosphoribosyl-ATP pyrophosphohydrolase
MSDDADVDPVLDDLFAVVEDRLRHRPDDSYTASLVDEDGDADRALEKLGEEAVEVVLAAKNDDGEALTHESADLVYHLVVVLAAYDLDVDDFRAELRRRRSE